MSPVIKGGLVIPMTENKTDKALADMEMNTILFYRDMKSILTSNKGKRYQFMMLNRTFEVLMYRSSQIKKQHCFQPEIKSPLDT